MTKILVIQPHKMLQQAIVVALFPDYHVQVSEKIPEAEPAADAGAEINVAAEVFPKPRHARQRQSQTRVARCALPLLH